MFLFVKRFKIDGKILFFLEKIGELYMERFYMILINLKLSFLLLDFKLRATIENVCVIRKGLTLEFDNKFFFLVYKFRSECDSDLLFLLGFKVIKKVL